MVTDKKDEALKLALEALEWINRVSAMDYEYQQKARESLNAIYEALAEQPALEQEIEELTAQRDKLADILTRTANALKGQPAELSLHSWHDLPEVAQQLKAAQQHEPMAVVSGYYGGQCVVLPTNPARIFNSGTAFYTSPQPSKPWVGLTDEEVDECYYWKGRQWTTDELVRHVEAKLREKNNG